MNNKIVIAGGSGFLGDSLIRSFKEKGFEIVILSRHPAKKVDDDIRYVQWDAQHLGDWVEELENVLAVINLVGKSVNCRYTEKNKNEIISSRVNATTIIGKAIQASNHPPKVWINAGSTAIFGNSGDVVKNEESKVGDGFSPEVCKRWEKSFHDIQTAHTRKVFLRIGLVFQTNGGLLKPFLNLVKFGLGGNIGTGEQYMSWIHEEDFVNVILWAIDREDAAGIIHCSSPFPIQNKVFMKSLRAKLKVPFGLPNIEPFIKLGAIFIGTEAELVLSGRRVVSKILEEKNFRFKYPLIDDALNELLN